MVALAHPRPSFPSSQSGGGRVAARVSRNSSEARPSKASAPSVKPTSQVEARMSVQKMSNIVETNVQACPERAVAFIRSRYPFKTAECVAADIGVPSGTVRRWLEGAASPSWGAFSRLIFAYGPAFLAAVYPKAPQWLDEAHRREMQATLRAEQQRISDQLAALDR